MGCYSLKQVHRWYRDTRGDHFVALLSARYCRKRGSSADHVGTTVFSNSWETGSAAPKPLHEECPSPLAEVGATPQAPAVPSGACERILICRTPVQDQHRIIGVVYRPGLLPSHPQVFCAHRSQDGETDASGHRADGYVCAVV